MIFGFDLKSWQVYQTKYSQICLFEKAFSYRAILEGCSLTHTDEKTKNTEILTIPQIIYKIYLTQGGIYFVH